MLNQQEELINCACGGVASGKGRTIYCNKCTRVVMKINRKDAINRWNEIVLQEINEFQNNGKVFKP